MDQDMLSELKNSEDLVNTAKSALLEATRYREAAEAVVVIARSEFSMAEIRTHPNFPRYFDDILPAKNAREKAEAEYQSAKANEMTAQSEFFHRVFEYEELLRKKPGRSMQ